MARILADENIPKSIATWLQSIGYDTVRTSEVGLKGAADSRILEYAKAEDRIILTLDLDFASPYYRMGGLFSVIIIRLHPATPDRIKNLLERFLAKIDLKSGFSLNSYILFSHFATCLVNSSKSEGLVCRNS